MEKKIEEIRQRLNQFKHIESYLGQDFERPINSLMDGYPELTATLVGRIVESLLKKFWMHHKIKGDPSAKTIQDLLKVCGKYIQNRRIYDYIIDIQRVRNRASHDSIEGVVENEDAIESVRKLLAILEWFKNNYAIEVEIERSKLSGDIQKNTQFINNFYSVLRYHVKHAYEVSENTAYILYERVTGTKYDYIEVFVSANLLEVIEILNKKKDGLLITSYPKKIRYIIVNHDYSFQEVNLNQSIDTKISTFDSFVGNFLEYGNYYSEIITRLNKKLIVHDKEIRLTGELLEFDLTKQDYVVKDSNNVKELAIDLLMNRKGNLFVISEAGGGKTTFCKNVLESIYSLDKNTYVFYLDLSLMRKGESLEDFITRQFAPYLKLNKNEIFDMVYFLNKEGYIVMLFDGLDELANEVTFDELMNIFSELTKIFSEKSRVVVTSRLSYFMTSKYLRELLNKNAIVQDRVRYGLSSYGIDPLQLPNFSVLKLNKFNLADPACSLKHRKLAMELQSASVKKELYCSPLEYYLVSCLPYGEVVNAYNHKMEQFNDAELIYKFIMRCLEPDRKNVLDDFVKFFYRSYQGGITEFELIDLFSYFGEKLFPDNIISFENMVGRDLFRQVWHTKIKFKHKCFYEFLFALGYMMEQGINGTYMKISGKIRDFIHEISKNPELFQVTIPPQQPDLILRKGFYIVGEGDKTLIKYNHKNVLFDRDTVTVREYLTFLEEIKGQDLREFEHPLQPEGWSHEPFEEKLCIKDYYKNEKYHEYPAVGIGFFSAYAFASYYGKRLPTSFEWECASRGKYGQLFSWGDEYNTENANSVDYWLKKHVVDYEVWKEFFDRNHSSIGHPLTADMFPNNRSPIGIRNSCGNVWELTSTLDEKRLRVIICGGGFDTSFKAIKSSSKGIYSLDRRSNVVGFRCCKDLDSFDHREVRMESDA